MAIIKEFMEFLKKYQVIGLAVAFIMGAASTTLITALVNDLIMPIIAVLMPKGDWQTMPLEILGVKLLVGHFLGAVINFIIIAFVVFLIVKMIMKEDATQKR